jgi:hypothetical protein
VRTTTGTYEIVEPRPDALCESLRAFGYSVQAAIADLIDNSISAGARNIWVHFEWAGSDSFLTLRDDGSGMIADELRDAMRPGSTSPLEQRGDGDLGRFGLGLKTASFSQCRRLTVRSRAVNSLAATRRWDLDYVRRTAEWRLLEGAEVGSEERLAELDHQRSGTIVLWEVIDRLVADASVGDAKAHRRFFAMIDQVEEHVAMVFHRFLGRGLRLFINGRSVSAWDPFLLSESATQRIGEERLLVHGEAITLRAYVLPHYTKISQETHRLAGGPQGWNGQQGFYIYRGDRLLVAGDWLGLGFIKEPHFSLARLAVDLPTSMDLEWDIDVRKSRARPPGVLRESLQRIARVSRETAVEVYRHRGKVLTPSARQDHVFAWERLVTHGKIHYRINRDHPLIAEVIAGAASPESVTALLRVLEETVPLPLIMIDAAENPDAQARPFEGTVPAEVSAVLTAVYRGIRARGCTAAEAGRRLLLMEPFQDHAHLVATLVDADV